MIDRDGISARIDRLADLTKRLAREEAAVEEGDDPLLYAERRDYLRAIRAGVAGLESARVALVQARQRLDGLWDE